VSKTEPTNEIVPGTLESLDATPGVLRAMLNGMPASTVEAPGPEGWSARDVLVHLASRQRAALEGRIRLMLSEDCPTLPALVHERMVRDYKLAQHAIAEIIDDHEATRSEMMGFVRSLTPAQLARTGNLPAAGIVSGADVVHHVAFHDLVHIAQINALLAEPIERARGAMRVFR
jgi:hypothetical protein